MISSLASQIEHLDPAMIWAILAERGMLKTPGRRRLVQRLTSGQLPRAEIEKLATGDFSGVSELMSAEEPEAEETGLNDLGAADGLAPTAHDLSAPERDPELPGVRAAARLRAGEVLAEGPRDPALIEYLISSLLGSTWNDYFQAEQRDAREGGDRWRRDILDLLPDWTAKGGFVGEVARRFLGDHEQAQAWQPPKGYSATAKGPDGKRQPIVPNSMQRLIPLRVAARRRFGNWSGPGAGKTLSATLTARHIGSELTVITCPNNVVRSWGDAIRNHFRGAKVATKTWAAGDAEFLVLNYEMLQQAQSAERVASFLGVHRGKVGLFVVDEVHQAKQREAQAITARRANVLALLNGVPDACRLIMSATPVINDLTEGARLVEMLTGADPLPDKRVTITNCVELHKALTCHGMRWLPDFGIEIRQPVVHDAAVRPAPRDTVVFGDLGPRGAVRRRVWAENIVPVDCTDALAEIYRAARRRLELERVLTEYRLLAIRRHVGRGERVLLYSMYRDGIDEQIAEALRADQHKIAFYSGEQNDEEKAKAIDDFKSGRVNVLVCTAAISTGIDELQHACAKVVLNVLPWTHAEYEQLIGRIWRQGQREQVEIIVPVTYAVLPDGKVWSWCMAKLLRIMDKRTIADAAVNGTIPEGQLERPEKLQARLLRVIAEWEAEIVQRAA